MKNPKIGIITQARISSTRLPRKVLLQLSGKSILEYHLQRLAKSQLPLFVATTTEVGSNDIIQVANENGAEVFQGSLEDVLDRFYNCALKFKLDYIVRVTSDCPLIDADLITQGVEMLLKSSDPLNSYVSNTFQRTFPRGNDFEVFSFELLQKAHKLASLASQREHVTPFLYSGKDPGIRILQVSQSHDDSDLRITLDTPEDMSLIKILIEKYYADQMSHLQITDLLRTHEDLRLLNSHIQQKIL